MSETLAKPSTHYFSWEVDPFSNPTTAHLVYRFPDAISLLGIAEYDDDVFAVNVGNWTVATSTAQAGSWSTWSLDMRETHWKPGKNWHDHHGGRIHGCKVYKIADIEPAVFLNGLTSLPAHPTTLLLADSGTGKVYSLDTKTGEYGVAINVAAMSPNTSFPVVLGVNGVHFAPGEDDYLYFTNSFKTPHFLRVPVDLHDGSPVGAVEVIVDSVAEYNGAPDDFAIDDAGNAWIANGAFNGLLKVDTLSGGTEVVLGGTDKSKVIGQTACQFGRAKKDVKRETLYITNTGGIAVPPPQGIVGGSVFALDTASL
jgi:sugar lactone lactonase YvrE